MRSTFSAVPLLLSSSFLYTVATAQEDAASDSLPTLILPAPEVTPTPNPAQTPTPPADSAPATSQASIPTPLPQIPSIETPTSQGFPTPSISISTIGPEADPTSLLTNPAITPAPAADTPITTILSIPGGEALTLVAIPTSTVDSDGDSIPSMSYTLNDVPIQPNAPLLVNDQQVHLNLPNQPSAPISSAGILFAPPSPPPNREGENPQANIVIGSATYAVPAAAAPQETELAIDTNPPSLPPSGQITNWLAVPSGMSTLLMATGTQTGGPVIQSTVNGGAVGGLGERLSLAGVGMGILGVGMVVWM